MIQVVENSDSVKLPEPLERGGFFPDFFFETSYPPTKISSSKSPHEIINCGRFPLWNIWTNSRFPYFYSSIFTLLRVVKEILKIIQFVGLGIPDPQWCRKWWSCISWLSKHSSNLQANLQTWATTFNWFRKLIQRWWQPENPGWPSTWVGWMVRCNLAQKW